MFFFVGVGCRRLLVVVCVVRCVLIVRCWLLVVRRWVLFVVCRCVVWYTVSVAVVGCSVLFVTHCAR